MEKTNSRGLFSTSLQFMVTNTPLELLKDNLVDYLSTPSNFTSLNGRNNYLGEILFNIDLLKNDYNGDIPDIDVIENNALDIVVDTFSKEFNINKNVLIELLNPNNKNEFSYNVQVLYDKFYSVRMQVVEDFLFNNLLMNRVQYSKDYEKVCDKNEISYRSLTQVYELKKEDYVYIWSIKDICKTLVNSGENFTLSDIFLACSDIDDEQLEVINRLAEARDNDGNSLSIKFLSSVYQSNNYPLLVNRIKNRILAIILTQYNTTGDE